MRFSAVSTIAAATALVAVMSTVSSTTVSAGDLPVYTIHRATGRIVVDGRLDEADWQAAPSAGPFAFPWLVSGEPEQTDVRMLWDDDFLYVSYTCADKYIQANHYDTNSATCDDDCVELFWNPNPAAGKAYNMFEMNCLGNLLSVYNNFERSIKERDSRILPPHIAQTIRGTVNNDSDSDEGWTLEIAIRFADYPELYGKLRPKPGERWRTGLNRCGGLTNPQYSQWSPAPTEKPNFHTPDAFGILVFSADPVR